MSLEDSFYHALEEWKDHCENNRYQSFDYTYLECEGYRKITEMGNSILPLIREELSKSKDDSNKNRRNPEHLWAYAITEICPDFKLKINEISGGGWVQPTGNDFIGLDRHKVVEATLRWLDENIQKYITSS